MRARQIALASNLAIVKSLQRQIGRSSSRPAGRDGVEAPGRQVWAPGRARGRGEVRRRQVWVSGRREPGLRGGSIPTRSQVAPGRGEQRWMTRPDGRLWRIRCALTRNPREKVDFRAVERPCPAAGRCGSLESRNPSTGRKISQGGRSTVTIRINCDSTCFLTCHDSLGGVTAGGLVLCPWTVDRCIDLARNVAGFAGSAQNRWSHDCRTGSHVCRPRINDLAAIWAGSGTGWRP